MIFIELLGIIALVVIIACFVAASRYYVSAYARATKRNWLDVMRDSHALEVYKASRQLERDKKSRQFFEVAFPLGDSAPCKVDIVFLSPMLGAWGIIVQEGSGSLYGGSHDETWLAVSKEGGENSERLFTNLSQQAEWARESLSSCVCEGVQEGLVSAHVVVAHAAGLNVLGASFADHIGCCRTSELIGHIEGNATQEEPLNSDDMKVVAHNLKAASNARSWRVRQDGQYGGLGDKVRFIVDANQWAKRPLADERPDSIGGQLAQRANQIAVDKANLDALTWERIDGIGADLATERNSDRIAELAAELRLIAKMNVDLSARLGIAESDNNEHLTPAGFAVAQREEAVAESKLSLNGPLPSTKEALREASEDGFFDALIDDPDLRSGKTDLL